MARASFAKKFLRDVGGIFVFDVPGDIFEDIDRLQSLAEGLAVDEQLFVIALLDVAAMEEEELGQHVPDRPRDVVAVAAILFKGLNSDAVGIASDELAHAARKFARPAADDPAALRRQGAEHVENELGARQELAIVGICDRNVRGFLAEPNRKRRIVEASHELREEFLAARRGRTAVVLDRIRDPAQKVSGEYGLPEVDWKDRYPNRKGSRNAVDDASSERQGAAIGGRPVTPAASV